MMGKAICPVCHRAWALTSTGNLVVHSTVGMGLICRGSHTKVCLHEGVFLVEDGWICVQCGSKVAPTGRTDDEGDTVWETVP